MSPARPCWIDGELVGADLPALRVDDRARSRFSLGRSCYTTARIFAGRPRWPERHAERLARDASQLGIGRLAPALVVRALVETANAAFGPHDGGRAAEGIVRVQASRAAAARIHLLAEPRPLGDDPPFWRACTAPFPHEGPMPWSGAKVGDHLLFALARDFSDAQGVDEALLVDRDGYLIEGARSNLVVVDRAGRLSTPDLERGGVAGIARQRLQELVPELAVRNVTIGELQRAEELIAINAVRGARSCVQLDRKNVGNGRPGLWSRRISRLLGDELPGVSRTRAS
jgi:branched-subunit amino acid aminotransferase/4-amino-4-deoxychorismate lyase